MVLRSRAGDWKEDPVLGPGLTKYIRGSNSESEIEMAIKQHFTRAGIDFEDYRERLQININS